MGHSGGSTSTPGDARVILNYSGDSGAGTTGQDVVDSASEENSSVPRRVLGKRRGEQLDFSDRSEKKGVHFLLCMFSSCFSILSNCSIKCFFLKLATVLAAPLGQGWV